MKRGTEPGVPANLRKMAAYKRFTEANRRIANSASLLPIITCPFSTGNLPTFRDWKYSFPLLHQVIHKCRNFFRFGIKSEVSCIENVNLRLRYVPAIGLRLRQVEREVILAPNHQQSWLPFAYPRLPLGVGVDVRTVVIEEVALNIHLAGLA